MSRDILSGRFVGESRDSGARYIARDGRVYARTAEGESLAGTAFTANGRELDRFESALQQAIEQRRQKEESK